MSGRPKYTKPDKNQPELLQQCRELGFVVWNLSNMGGKISDALLMYGGQCRPVEIKSPGKRDQFTAGEKEGQAECANVDVVWIIAERLSDILVGFGLMEKEEKSDE